MVVNGAPVVIDSFPSSQHPAARHRSAFRILGSLETLLAICIICVGVIGFINVSKQLPEFQHELEQGRYDLNDLYNQNSKLFKHALKTGSNELLAFNIVTGILVMIAALMAFLSANRPTNCNVIAGMVLTIFCAIFGGFQALYAIQIIIFVDLNEVDSPSYLLHLFNALCAAIMFKVALAHSAICCSNTCCKPKRMQQRGTTVISQQHTIQVEPGYAADRIAYYDFPEQQGYVPEYVDDRMDQKLIEA